MDNQIQKLKEQGGEIKREVRGRSLGYIVTALGLVAGLAWNEAIKSLIEVLFPMSKNSIWAKFIYAVFITIVIVVITVYLMRFLGKKEDKK